MQKILAISGFRRPARNALPAFRDLRRGKMTATMTSDLNIAGHRAHKRVDFSRAGLAVSSAGGGLQSRATPRDAVSPLT